jgi:hypothetical protein
LLDRLKVKGQQLGASQTAPDQHRDHGVIPQLARGGRRRRVDKSSALFRREPVTEAYTDATHALHATNSGGQFRTQEPGIGCLVRDASDGGRPKIDRGWAHIRVVPGECGIEAPPCG